MLARVADKGKGIEQFFVPGRHTLHIPSTCPKNMIPNEKLLMNLIAKDYLINRQALQRELAAVVSSTGLAIDH